MNMPRRHEGSGRGSPWYYIGCVVLAAVLAWQCLSVFAAGTSRNLMFDGGMNLEVSRSIAEGHGPRRIYDFREVFPPGVQSKEPLVLAGAVSFALFGVGPWQAQLPNMVYFALLVALVVVVVRRVSDLASGLAAAVLALTVPQMTQYALGGYGEIPTLFYGLASLAVVAWPGTRCTPSRALVAGVLAGLALATKVVGIVQVGVVGLVLCVRVLVEMRPLFRPMFRAVLAFVAGMLLPLLMVECWRWFWLGTTGYLEWWDYQLMSILFQVGATATEPVTTDGPKLLRHFDLLAGYLQAGRLWTLALLAMPVIGVGLLFATSPSAWRLRARWLLLGLALLVGVYFPWWLTIVPTEKAWLRYIYMGLMSLGALAGIGLVGHLVLALGKRTYQWRVLHLAMAMSLGIVYAPFVASSLKVPVKFGPDQEVLAVQYAAALVSELPSEALVFGFGWYAAPTIQLYVDRGFLDFTDWPVGRLQGHTAYFVADRASLVTDVLRPWLDRYPYRKLMRDNQFAQVYEVEFSDPSDPFATMDISGVRSEVTDFSNPGYDLVWGMEPYDPMGGRFTQSDSEILLRYEGQDGFHMRGYMALPSFFRFPEPLSGRILIGDCPPISFAFDGTGWQDFAFKLECRPPVGTNVRARLLFDNVFALATMYDHQRALLLSSIGFSR
jgi:hypothetical protein